MLIDRSTSITAIVSIVTAMFTAVLTVYISEKKISKVRCYIAIIAVALLIISSVLLLHFWSFISEQVPIALQEIWAHMKDEMRTAEIAIINFMETSGKYLLLGAGLAPWSWLFLRTFLSNIEHNVLTSFGHFIFSILLPILAVAAEIVISFKLFGLLQSIHQIGHLLWIIIVSLFLHVIVVRVLYRQFSKLWRD